MRHGLFCGDLDDVEFIQEVEERFGVALDDAEYNSCQTIGDFRAVLMRRLGAIERGGGKCASQMAFYRLRKAAGPGNEKAGPETRLEALGLGNAGKTMRKLQHCGLKVPGASPGALGLLSTLIATASFMVLAVAWLKNDSTIAAISTPVLLASIALVIIAPRKYPDGMETIGELAQAVARRNVMMLKAHGAGLRPGDIWESLRDLAADLTGKDRDAIEPETPLYQQKVKHNAA